MVVVVFTENLLIKRLFQSTSPTKSGGGPRQSKTTQIGGRRGEDSVLAWMAVSVTEAEN